MIALWCKHSLIMADVLKAQQPIITYYLLSLLFKGSYRTLAIHF